MKSKFIILCAGLGTRNTYYKNLHKALLPVENKPAISHIIDNISDEFDIIIAVGHKSDQIKSYINFVYPNKNISFLEINPYEGPNSGPGITLLQCKPYIREPFIFTSVDTIIPKNIKHIKPITNWIGVNKLSNSSYACVVENKLERISNIPPIYIGIAGVYDWVNFFDNLENSKSVEVTDALKNTLQVITTLEGLKEKVESENVAQNKVRAGAKINKWEQ